MSVNSSCSEGEGRSREDYDLTVAVIGNPNVGKSTLFNVLTGASAHVANWPGVTVSAKEGFKEWSGLRIRFVDLPGIYGLSALTLEEVVSREYIVEGDADLVVGLVDATAPERSLYLPIQLLELIPNVIIVFTKTDEMSKLGIHVHYDKLESILGVPVIPVSAIQGKGIRELLDAIVEASRVRKRDKPLYIDYGNLEPFIADIFRAISESKTLKKYSIRWASIRLLEGDKRLEDLLLTGGELEIYNKVQQIREALRRSIGRDPAELIINTRFKYVSDIVKEVIVRVERELAYSNVIDKAFSKPFIGMLLSIAIMFTSFLTVFSINTGFPLNLILRYVGLPQLAEAVETYSLSGLIGEAFNRLSEFITAQLYEYNPLLTSLVSDGVLIGLGAVMTFLPLILMVFLMLAVLEDSGLAPRMAISFHNTLSRFGYSGRAVYPLIVSMGCNVPGVLTSRTSVDDVERIQMVFSTSFIPCQARLVVTSALVAAYFTTPLHQTLAILSMYFVGISMYLTTGLLLRRAVFKAGGSPELILEIPLIHLPKLKVVWWIAWDYTKHFLKKAGMIILSLSIAVWVLINAGPTGIAESIEGSFGGIIGRAVAPLLLPLDIVGENAWEVAFALVQGFVAKESVLGAIALMYGEADVSGALKALNLTVPQAYSLMLFITLYIPCVATMVAVFQESKSLKLTIIQALYTTSTAYVISIVTYHLLKFLTSVV